MTEELTYETIPKEFWPKCDWCGTDIDQFHFDYHEAERGKPLGLCERCRNFVLDMIWGYVPEVLRAFFDSNSIKQYEEHVKSKWTYKESLEVAIQNMKDHARHTERINEIDEGVQVVVGDQVDESRPHPEGHVVPGGHKASADPGRQPVEVDP